MNSWLKKTFTNLVKTTLAVTALTQVASLHAEERAIEEVVVVAKSIKASQLASIEAKRLANNVADVISADAIGRFPDQNLADALGRIPGVSIERDQGQARYINFRGAPKRYTTVAFDGIDVPGTQNGRVPRFDAYPAVITSQIVANKAITADMPGESVSGFINVRTFRPSDIEGFNASVELGTGKQELGDGLNRKQNAKASFSNDKFGVLFYGSENLREQITDNREMEYIGGKGAQIPDTIEYRNYYVDRKDEAYGGMLEYYLENGGRLYVSSLNTEFQDKEQRNEWRFKIASGAASVGHELTPVKGTTPVSRVRRLWEDGEYINETDVNTVGADLLIGEWDVNMSYSQIDTGFYTFLPIPYFLRGEVKNLSYDISNAEEPIVTFDGNLADVEYPLKWYVDAYSKLDTETDQFKFDISRANDWGEMKFGLKYDDREAEGEGAGLYIVVTDLNAAGKDVLANIKDYDLPDKWDTGMKNSIGGFYASNRGLRTALNESGLPSKPDIPNDQIISLEETIISAYAMQTIDRDWGNIVLGVRVEDTDYDTTGSKLVGTEFSPLTVTKSYTNVLPNAHVNWDFAEDKKLRFSFSTGISRPTYIESRAAAEIDVISNQVDGGNPDLEEETSWGFDAAYEWYFADASILSVTVFYRAIDNVIFESGEKVLGSIYSDGAAPGELWDLKSFGNGKDGELTGLEIAFTGRLDNYLEGFWSGFGLEANMTAIDSEFVSPTGTKLELPGQSDLAYNASIFYEDYNLSARLSYRYRDSWLDETEATEGAERAGIFWDEQVRLDFSLRYDLEELTGYKASLFLDVNNITDETDVRYTAKDWNPNQVESYGRRYLVGMRFSI